ncbi:MAG: hypothetical protein MUC65_06875 [Pontiellaceae bacterium]|jgi:hypothetical protein|nr:hypothetical protein [Pontiellaceae bacterium]
MKIKTVVSGTGIILLLAGCASVLHRQATVADGVIQNSALGVSGFSLKLPDGYTLYQPNAETPQEWNELQRMAIRIYDLNRDYHPRGNELFYESFLLMSDTRCFLLVTLKANDATRLDPAIFDSDLLSQADLLPLYNVTESRSAASGGSRFSGVFCRGSAYERDGLLFPKSKKNSLMFNYEAYKVDGGNRDQYVLMGMALPDHAGSLTAPMRQIMDDMKF